MQFLVDGLSVSAFFRPPEEVAASIGSAEASLVAVSILCDLAAEVRPKEVEVNQRCLVPDFAEVFSDAVCALMAEEDAYWSRSGFLSPPILRGFFANRKSSNYALDHNKVVLGFSGGKDSIVSLFALLAAGYEVVPVLLNEGDRTWQETRKWIPKLKTLGLQPLVGFLSAGRRRDLQDFYGNWYFSSYQIGWLVATLALCAAGLRAGIVCLGIEASADVSWRMYRGRRINHQHQKTAAHLRLLEKFYRRTLNRQIRIGSPIAELTDTEVVKVLLAKVPKNFQEFSSCGASNSRTKHCGNCAKCAFIYALLSASGDGRDLAGRIFHTMPFEAVDLYRPWLDSRFRLPPGCIGQRAEVWSALEALVQEGSNALVVQTWKRSSLRRRLLCKGLDRNGGLTVASAPSSLTRPVAPASRLVKAWSNL